MDLGQLLENLTRFSTLPASVELPLVSFLTENASSLELSVDKVVHDDGANLVQFTTTFGYHVSVMISDDDPNVVRFCLALECDNVKDAEAVCAMVDQLRFLYADKVGERHILAVCECPVYSMENVNLLFKRVFSVYGQLIAQLLLHACDCKFVQCE